MESFTVKFMLLKPDGYWKHCEETFYGKRKDSHSEAEKECKLKYGVKKVKIKSIIYQ